MSKSAIADVYLSTGDGGDKTHSMTINEQENSLELSECKPKSTVSPSELIIPNDDLIYETHPDALRWFHTFPLLRHIPVFNRVTETFGPKFSVSLGACYVLSKGASSNIINVSRQPMFMRRYRISTIRFQRLSATYALGWSMKAFVAVFTDIFPLFGYSKRWYMTLSAFIGTAFALAYALLPARQSSANPAAAFIFLTCFAKANIDILSEGLFSRFMRLRPKAGAAVVSWVWAMTYVGTTISASMMGPLSDVEKTWVGVLVSAILQFVIAIFFVFNFYGEQPNRVERHNDAVLQYLSLINSEQQQEEEEQQQQSTTGQELREEMEANTKFDNNDNTAKSAVSATKSREPSREEEYDEVEVEGEDGKTGTKNGVISPENGQIVFHEPKIVSCLCDVFEFNQDVLIAHWRLAILCIVITCCTIIMACVTILGSKWQLLYTCVVVGPVICIGAFCVLPPAIARAALFTYLSSILYWQFPAVLSAFYMTNPDCHIDAPRFTYTFYITVSNVVGDVAGVIASILFTYLFSQHSYPSVFAITTLLEIVGSFFDLLIVRRWNLAIGIPDKVAYLLGDSVIEKICIVLSMMPQQVLMSRLCPRGTESMVFAAMAGYNNAGISMSMAMVSIIMETRWPVSSKPPCNYDNLQWLIIVGHFACPLLILPLAYILLPWARVCDAIDIHGNAIPKKTSDNEHTAEAEPIKKELHSDKSYNEDGNLREQQTEHSSQMQEQLYYVKQSRENNYLIDAENNVLRDGLDEDSHEHFNN